MNGELLRFQVGCRESVQKTRRREDVSERHNVDVALAERLFCKPLG